MTVRRPGLLVASILAAGACHGLATAQPVAESRQPESPALTYTRDIAPLVLERCTPCHRAGGSAPFELLGYDSVRRRATQLVHVVESRFMPPWKVAPGNEAFVGQHPLSQDEIDRITRWVAAGAPEGDPADMPPARDWPQGWQLGTPDLVVSLAEPYVLAPEGTDVFRIFTLRVPIDGTRYVRGLEFRPGNPKVVHHANIRIDRSPTSRALDAEDPAPGYEGLLARTAVYPDGHFLGWTPGQLAPLVPGDLGWPIEPDTDLVVELHLQPSGAPETVNPSIGLYFGTAPPTRTPAILRLGSQAIDIPAGEARYDVRDRFVLPVDVELLAVQPHAHYRARQVEGTAALPDGTSRRLLRIDDWDFRWQHVYRYVSPLRLPAGTTLSMHYVYDNSAANPRNPRQPPVRATWGQRSADEMGDLWFQVLTADEADRRVLNEAARRKMAADDVIGGETLLRADPTDAALHDDVALLCLELGRVDRALEHFEQSARLRPRAPAAHFNFGTTLAMAGRIDEAIVAYQRALELKPDYVVAHANLGHALVARGDLDGAAARYRRALALDPTQASAHNNLGAVLLELGQIDEALALLAEAVHLDAAYAEAQFNLGRGLAARGDHGDAVVRLRRALQLRPGWAAATIELAWLLATSSEARVRRPAEALALAERARASLPEDDSRSLDTLAAAYAAAGRFDDAVTAASAALKLAPGEGARTAITDRLERYRRGEAYRTPRP